MAARYGAFVVVSLVVCTATVLAASGFAITVGESLDTPTRTVEFGGQEYEISSVATVSPNDRLHARVTAQNETVYRLYLYNGDRQIVASKRATQSASFTFDLTGFDPGSYMLAVDHNGVIETVHPVMIRGYHLSVDAPKTVRSTDRLDVRIGVTVTAPIGPPARVQVTVANNTTAIRRNATRHGPGLYTATVPVTSLDPGEYRLYAVAHGEDRVFGRQELLGMSRPNELQIRTPETPTSDSPTETTATVRTTETEAPSTSVTSQPAPTSEGGNGVITPAPSPTPGESPTTADGRIASVIALLILVLGAWWRRSRRS